MGSDRAVAMKKSNCNWKKLSVQKYLLGDLLRCLGVWVRISLMFWNEEGGKEVLPCFGSYGLLECL